MLSSGSFREAQHRLSRRRQCRRAMLDLPHQRLPVVVADEAETKTSPKQLTKPKETRLDLVSLFFG